MTVPSTVSTIPNQQNAPSATITPLDIKPYFTDADAVSTLTYSATGFPASTGLSISSSTGVISGTPTSQDLAASYNITVRATDAANSAIFREVTVPVVVSTPPSPAAQNYYINATTGNDAWDGKSATFVSGTNGPWRSLSRANTVPAHASGHVDINVAPGDFRNQQWAPANGGTDATHKIRLRVNGTGVVNVLGPSTGPAMQHPFEITVNWIEVMRESATTYFKIDGEVVFGTGGGQLQKGGDPASVGRIEQAVFISGSNVTVDMDIVRCIGWSVFAIDSDVSPANIVCRCNFDQCGTPYYPGAEDFADHFFVAENYDTTKRVLLDGGTTGRIWKHPGHALGVVYGATGAIRNIFMNGWWGDMPTFNPGSGIGTSAFIAGDGNRATQFSGRGALNWHMYNCIIQRNGQPADQPRVELTKLEGTSACISDSILRNSDHNVLEMSTAPWSWVNQSNRICHCVCEYINGLFVSMRDYAGVGSPGNGIPDDFQAKNLILKNINQNPESQFANYILDINLDSGDWADVVQMHGITVQDATRDGDDFLIYIAGAGGPGSHTVNWYIANHPANFSNWTFTTDANLDNAPAADVDADITDIQGEYTPVSDSHSVGQGVNLTLANGAGSGSTTLVVDDSRWFDNPADGLPSFGQQSEGFFVHINGVGNREYTAINYATHTITLSATATWADNAAVNKKITSGSAPNRGIR